MLRDLVPFVQFKKREEHAWRSATFSTVAGSACDFTKSNTPPWVFFKFLKLNKSRNASHMKNVSSRKLVLAKIEKIL